MHLDLQGLFSLSTKHAYNGHTGSLSLCQTATQLITRWKNLFMLQYSAVRDASTSVHGLTFQLDSHSAIISCHLEEDESKSHSYRASGLLLLNYPVKDTTTPHRDLHGSDKPFYSTPSVFFVSIPSLPTRARTQGVCILVHT
jgi:hypothetical protein